MREGGSEWPPMRAELCRRRSRILLPVWRRRCAAAAAAPLLAAALAHGAL